MLHFLLFARKIREIRAAPEITAATAEARAKSNRCKAVVALVALSVAHCVGTAHYTMLNADQWAGVGIPEVPRSRDVAQLVPGSTRRRILLCGCSAYRPFALRRKAF